MAEGFTQEFVDGVRDHLNEDHAEHMLLIARAFMDAQWATEATVVSVDHTGFVAELSDGARSETKAFSFDAPLTKAKLWRTEIIKVVRAAREELGVSH
jgi:hypothetical protein